MGDLVRQGQMLFGIDPVQARAHDGDGGYGPCVHPCGLQRSGVGSSVNAQCHARDHDKACLRQGLGEIMRVGGTLRCRVATAHNRNACGLRPVQSGASIGQHVPAGFQPHAIQNRWWVFQLQQATRVSRIAQRQHTPLLRVRSQPIQRAAQQVIECGRGLAQRVCLRRTDHGTQRGLAALENLLGQSKSPQQLPRALVADARCQRKPQPSRQVRGVLHQGPASASPTRTPSWTSVRSAYAMRS